MRNEVSVYNEATAFIILSQDKGGQDFSDVSSSEPQWRSAVEDGVFLPIQLVQDNSFGVRVVVDEPLTEDEEAHWVDHWTARFVVSGDTLTIAGGGLEYLWGEDMEEYTEHIPVPSGMYRADFYTYLPGVNGSYCLSSVPGDDEPLGTYFRRTRPDEEFPYWLQEECAEDPEADPGHDEEWEDFDYAGDDDGPAYCDFLLRLTSVSEAEFAALSAVPLSFSETSDPQGWIEIAINPRKPEKFPLGLISPEEEEDEE